MLQVSPLSNIPFQCKISVWKHLPIHDLLNIIISSLVHHSFNYTYLYCVLNNVIHVTIWFRNKPSKVGLIISDVFRPTEYFLPILSSFISIYLYNVDCKAEVQVCYQISPWICIGWKKSVKELIMMPWPSQWPIVHVSIQCF